MPNFLRRYNSWILAIAVGGFMLWFGTLGHSLPLMPQVSPVPKEAPVPELTPADRAKLEEMNRELRDIQKELDKLNRLRKMYKEGKLWRA